MPPRGKKRVAEPPEAALPDTRVEQPPEVVQCVMAIAASSADMAHLPSAAVGHAILMLQCSDAAAIAEEVFDKFDKVAAPRWTALENWAVFDSGMQAADAMQKRITRGLSPNFRGCVPSAVAYCHHAAWFVGGPLGRQESEVANGHLTPLCGRV